MAEEFNDKEVLMRSAKLTFLALCLTALSSTGCGWVARKAASVAGSSEQCIDGVTYLQFASGASVKYMPDGKIATCK